MKSDYLSVPLTSRNKKRPLHESSGHTLTGYPAPIHLFTLSSQGSVYPIARSLSPRPAVVGSTITPISPRNVSTWFTSWTILLAFQSRFLPCNSWHINHPETRHHTNCENEKRERKGSVPHRSHLTPYALYFAVFLHVTESKTCTIWSNRQK